MNLKHRRMKTTAHHGAAPEHYGAPTARPPKAGADSVKTDMLRQIFEQTTTRELQHGPCYRIDPATGERTIIE